MDGSPKAPAKFPQLVYGWDRKAVGGKERGRLDFVRCIRAEVRGQRLGSGAELVTFFAVQGAALHRVYGAA